MARFADLGPQLVGWLPSRRWFQAKDRRIEAVRIADTGVLGADMLLVLAEVRYGSGAPDRYLVPLAAADSGDLEAEGRAWKDAFADPPAVRLLAERTCTPERIETVGGEALHGVPVTGERPPPGSEVRALGVEQSNTSAVIGEAYILKAFRRLEAGTHPDVELPAVLTREGFEHVPAQHGSLHLAGAGGTTALAVLSQYARGAREGWELATEETARLGRGDRARRAVYAPPHPESGVLGTLGMLGQAVAELHLTLGKTLGTRRAGPGQADRWAVSMAEQAERVLAGAARLAPAETAQVRARVGEIHALVTQLGEIADPGPLVRVHGDLHLGQVLLAPGGRWLLLDFEGEPLRPLAARRAHGSPLRDVAGMLRSFDYAAAEPHGGGIPPAAGAWRDTARERFLEGYTARAETLVPPGAEVLLTAWELEKAVYELGYELANRPDWVRIPVGGILRLLDAQQR